MRPVAFSKHKKNCKPRSMKAISLYDKSQVNKETLLFDSKALWKLLIPVMIEQLLTSFMGMADSVMVSRVGSAAISAVSLTDSINVLVIQVLAALATGGTIICSQYLGRRSEESDRGCQAGSPDRCCNLDPSWSDMHSSLQADSSPGFRSGRCSGYVEL